MQSLAELAGARHGDLEALVREVGFAPHRVTTAASRLSSYEALTHVSISAMSSVDRSSPPRQPEPVPETNGPSNSLEVIRMSRPDPARSAMRVRAFEAFMAPAPSRARIGRPRPTTAHPSA